MSARVFFDTNVIIYAFDRLDEAKHLVARRLLDEHVSDGSFSVSIQVLQEFYAVATRKLRNPAPPAKARAIVAELAQHRVVEPTSGMLLRGIDLSVRRQLSLWDALILEAARDAGCSTVLTEDMAHGSSIEGLRITNPFRTGAATPQP
jgi:predicted nucleic acid-binding protein